MPNDNHFSFVLPSLKIAGGTKEAIRLAEEVEGLGCAVDFFIMWVSLKEISNLNKNFFYLSRYKTNAMLALPQMPIIILNFLILTLFKIKNARSRNWIFTHYTTFPLALFIPRSNCFFFVQGVEWLFVKNKYISSFLKRFILFFYRRGEVLTANRYLTLCMKQNGIEILAELPIWADANFLYVNSNKPARVFDFAMVLRKGDTKRLDLYLEFISISNFEKRNWRFSVITPDEDLALLFQPLVSECLVNPSINHMRELYAKSKYFLLFSDSEGFGLPPLEAMGAGCVPICRNSGGVSAYMVRELNQLVLPLDLDINSIVCFADKLRNGSNWDALSSLAVDVFVEGLNNSKNRAKLLCSIF